MGVPVATLLFMTLNDKIELVVKSVAFYNSLATYEMLKCENTYRVDP